MKKIPSILLLATFLMFLVLPFIMSDAFTFRLSELLILILFAASFQFIARTAGMFSLGHASFYGVGAYTSAVLIQKGHSIFLAVIMAGIIAVFVSLVIGYLSLKSIGIYFAMLTLSLGQVVYLIIYRTPSLGGQDGIPGVFAKPITLFGWEFDISRPENLYFVILFVVTISIIIIYYLTNSALGHYLRSIRENSVRTSSLGINVKRYQMLAFGIAGFFGGVAGSMLSPLEGIITPETLAWTQSALPLIIVLIGGINSFWGPVVGAITYEVFHALTINSGASHLYLGIILLIVVLVFPNGVIGISESIVAKFRKTSNNKEHTTIGVDKNGNSPARRSI